MLEPGGRHQDEKSWSLEEKEMLNQAEIATSMNNIISHLNSLCFCQSNLQFNLGTHDKTYCIAMTPLPTICTGKALHMTIGLKQSKKKKQKLVVIGMKTFSINHL